MRWRRHLARRNGLVRQPEATIPPGEPAPRLEDSITETGSEGVNWFHLVQGIWALVNTERNFQVPSNVRSFLTGRSTISFSSWTILRDVNTKLW
jgi:deoxycytidine triphosphate deaminase